MPLTKITKIRVNFYCNFLASGAGGDRIPPTISGCPDDIIWTLPTGNFANVDWVEPTATDNSGVATLRSQTRRPGSFFQIKQPVDVIYTFEDSAGNVATCTFSVSVIRVYKSFFLTLLTCLIFLLSSNMIIKI